MNIHSAAIVSADARLGSNVIIGPYAIIEPHTDIGDDSEIRAHAVVKRFTTIGSSNTVYEGVVLGGEPQDAAYKDCRSYLHIGSNNRIRESVTIHRGTQPESVTTVGSGCFIMTNAHVAHNCHVGDGVIIANNVALAGYVDIGDQAFISGGVVVHQFCRIGRLSMIGGNSKIVQDCLPFVITDGVPGRARGVNIVGLQRAGLESNEFRNLKAAYQILLRSGLSLESALERLTELDDPLVYELIDFVRASTRGFCHKEVKTQRARS
jgi:UDP-N-acetylglucosamine acyltransferase